jgi:hypothetical protein
MSRDLMDLVLPRLSQRLDRQLRRYRAGKLNDAEFSQRFENLLQQQHAWLANQGVSDFEAAVAVHAAVLILSEPGLHAEAAERKVPLEMIEFQAVCEAAEDIAEHYDVDEGRVLRRLSRLVALYAD